jgi:hypothetical protein
MLTKDRVSLILMKCGQSSVFRVAYNDGRLKTILSVPGGENSICSSMGCSIDNLKKIGLPYDIVKG